LESKHWLTAGREDKTLALLVKTAVKIKRKVKSLPLRIVSEQILPQRRQKKFMASLCSRLVTKANYSPLLSTARR